MMGITGLILLPLYLAMFLMDVAIFFLLVHLLSYVFPVRPLLFLDRIGSPTVEVVTGAVCHHTKRWWKRPLSHRQEEALALLLLSVTRWLIALGVK